MSRKPYAICKDHRECRKVKSDMGVMSFSACPWCEYPVSTSNPYKWCANCYSMFRIFDKKWVHFSHKFEKSIGEVWAIAIAKSGGVKIGKVVDGKEVLKGE